MSFECWSLRLSFADRTVICLIFAIIFFSTAKSKHAPHLPLYSYVMFFAYHLSVIELMESRKKRQ